MVCGSTTPSTIRPDRTRKLRLVREHGLDRERAQARLGLVLAAPHRVSECQAAALGVRECRLGRVVRAALRDRAVEQARGQGGGEVRMHAQPTGGLAEDRHVVAVAAELRDVALDPPQRGLLVHEPVVARGLVGRFGAQRRVREEAEEPEAVVQRDDDRALLDQPRRVVVVALAHDQRAAVQPDHHRKALGLLELGLAVLLLRHLAVRGEHVQVQAVLGGRTRCRRATASCGQWLPNWVASRGPCHRASGCGGCQRSSPTGGAA